MTERHVEDQELRDAFQALGHASHEAPSPADIDQIWRAVSGDLPAEERRRLVDRMATDAALAESWRIAQELYQAAPRSEGGVTPTRFWTRSWMGAAAALLVAVGVGVAVQLWRLTVQDTFRESAAYVVESQLKADASLPRNAFRLQWTPGPAGSRYRVRVTTEDLTILTTASDLSAPELVVSRERLSTVTSGSRVFWQVDVTLPEGTTVSSQTFVVRVQ